MVLSLLTQGPRCLDRTWTPVLCWPEVIGQNTCELAQEATEGCEGAPDLATPALGRQKEVSHKTERGVICSGAHGPWGEELAPASPGGMVSLGFLLGGPQATFSKAQPHLCETLKEEEGGRVYPGPLGLPQVTAELG